MKRVPAMTPACTALVLLSGLLTGCGSGEDEGGAGGNDTAADQDSAQTEKTAPDDENGGAPDQEGEGDNPWGENGASQIDGPVFVSLDGIERFVRNVGSSIQRRGDAWQFRVQGQPVMVIADPPADRIRIQTPVTESAKLGPQDWRRVMSANFDTAVDARYAAARDILWSVFVHRFSTLTREDFVSGLRQCLNLVATYGGAYASTGQAFGGGDLADPEGGAENGGSGAPESPDKKE